MTDKINRIVLAFSGGLDTSVILKWLQQTYDCEVVTFTADLGQGEELEPARQKARLMGVKEEHIFIDDLREEYVETYGQDPGEAYYSAGGYTPVIPLTYWSFRLMIGLGMAGAAGAVAVLRECLLAVLRFSQPISQS